MATRKSVKRSEFDMLDFHIGFPTTANGADEYVLLCFSIRTEFRIVAKISLTRKQWPRFLAFLESIKPCSDKDRTGRIVLGYDFDADRSIFDKQASMTVRDWRTMLTETVRLLRSIPVPGPAFEPSPRASASFLRHKSRERRRQKTTGLFERIHLKSGRTTVSIPRRLMLRIRRECLRDRVSIARQASNAMATRAR